MKWPLLNVKQVAERAGVSRERVYEAVRSGALPHVRVLSSIRVRQEAVEEWRSERPHLVAAQDRRRRGKRCTVYFVQCEVTGNIKIGITAGAVEVRVSQLQNGSPTRLRLLGTVSDLDWPETLLHEKFRDGRLHGEWFTPCQDLLEFIEAEADKL